MCSLSGGTSSEQLTIFDDEHQKNNWANTTVDDKNKATYHTNFSVGFAHTFPLIKLYSIAGGPYNYYGKLPKSVRIESLYDTHV